MGDTQSAQRDARKDEAAEEESDAVEDAQEEQRTEDKPFINNGQISEMAEKAGKAGSSLAAINGHCEEEITADAALSPDEEVSETDMALKEEAPSKHVESIDTESPYEAEASEDTPHKMIEIDAKRNDVNDSFRRFFSNIGLRLTIKRGSTDLLNDLPAEANKEEPISEEDAEVVVEEPENENAETKTDMNTAQETCDNDSTTCPTMTDVTPEEVLENAEEKAAEAKEEVESDVATSRPVVEDTEQDGSPEEEGHYTSSPEQGEVVSPIKRFFKSGIFSGLRKKRKTTDDDTTDKEMVDYVKKEVEKMTDETEQDQDNECIDPGVEAAASGTELKEIELKEIIPGSIAVTIDEEKSTTRFPSTFIIPSPEILNSQERNKVHASPLKRLMTGSSFKRLAKRPKGRDSSDSKLSDSGEHASDQLMSSSDSAENQKEEEGPQTTPEAAGEEDGPWASFKKLLTPKKHRRASSSSKKESETPASVEEPKPNEEEQISDHSTEESTKRKDSVSWEAVLCGSGKKRSRKTSDSEDDTPEENKENKLELGPKNRAELPQENTHEKEIKNVVSSPKQSHSPLVDDAGSTWRSLKRLVTPKRKAKDDDESKDNIQSDSEVSQDESSFSIKKLLPGRKKRKSVEKPDQVSSDEADKVPSDDEDSETPAVVPLSEFDIDDSGVLIQTQVDIESHIPKEADHQEDIVQPVMACDNLESEARKMEENEDTPGKQVLTTPAKKEPDDVKDLISTHQQLSDITEEGILTETMATPASVNEEAGRDETIAEDLMEITSEAITAPEPVSVTTLADETEMISAVSQLSSESSKTSGNTTPVPAEYEVMETDTLLHQVVETISTSPKAVPVSSTNPKPESIVGSVLHQIFKTFLKEDKEKTILEIHKSSDATAINTGETVKELEALNELAATAQTESISEVSESDHTEVLPEVLEMTSEPKGVHEGSSAGTPQDEIEFPKMDSQDMDARTSLERKPMDTVTEEESENDNFERDTTKSEGVQEPDELQKDQTTAVESKTGGFLALKKVFSEVFLSVKTLKDDSKKEAEVKDKAEKEDNNGVLVAEKKVKSEDLPLKKAEDDITELIAEPEDQKPPSDEHVQEPDRLEVVQTPLADASEKSVVKEVILEDVEGGGAASEQVIEERHKTVDAPKSEEVQASDVLQRKQEPPLDTEAGSLPSFEDVKPHDIPETKTVTAEPKQDTEVGVEPEKENGSETDAIKTEIMKEPEKDQTPAVDSKTGGFLSLKKVFSDVFLAVKTLTDDYKKEAEVKDEAVKEGEALVSEEEVKSEDLQPEKADKLEKAAEEIPEVNAESEDKQPPADEHVKELDVIEVVQAPIVDARENSLDKEVILEDVEEEGAASDQINEERVPITEVSHETEVASKSEEVQGSEVLQTEQGSPLDTEPGSILSFEDIQPHAIPEMETVIDEPKLETDVRVQPEKEYECATKTERTQEPDALEGLQASKFDLGGSLGQSPAQKEKLEKLPAAETVTDEKKAADSITAADSIIAVCAELEDKQSLMSDQEQEPEVLETDETAIEDASVKSFQKDEKPEGVSDAERSTDDFKEEAVPPAEDNIETADSFNSEHNDELDEQALPLPSEVENIQETEIRVELEDKIQTEVAETDNVKELDALKVVEASKADSEEGMVQIPEEEVKPEGVSDAERSPGDLKEEVVPPAEANIETVHSLKSEHNEELDEQALPLPSEVENIKETEIRVELEDELETKVAKTDNVQELDALKVVEASKSESEEGIVQIPEEEVKPEGVSDAERSTDDLKEEVVPPAEANIETVDSLKSEHNEELDEQALPLPSEVENIKETEIRVELEDELETKVAKTDNVQELDALKVVEASKSESEEGIVQIPEEEVKPEGVSDAESSTDDLKEEVVPPAEANIETVDSLKSEHNEELDEQTLPLPSEVENIKETEIRVELEDELETKVAKTDNVQELDALKVVEASKSESEEGIVQIPEEEVKPEELPPLEAFDKSILTEDCVLHENKQPPVIEQVQEAEVLDSVQALIEDAGVQYLEKEAVSEDVPEDETAPDEPKEEIVPLTLINSETVDASKSEDVQESEVLQTVQVQALDSMVHSLLSLDTAAVETDTDEPKLVTEVMDEPKELPLECDAAHKPGVTPSDTEDSLNETKIDKGLLSEVDVISDHTERDNIATLTITEGSLGQEVPSDTEGVKEPEETEQVPTLQPMEDSPLSPEKENSQDMPEAEVETDEPKMETEISVKPEQEDECEIEFPQTEPVQEQDALIEEACKLKSEEGPVCSSEDEMKSEDIPSPETSTDEPQKIVEYVTDLSVEPDNEETTLKDHFQEPEADQAPILQSEEVTNMSEKGNDGGGLLSEKEISVGPEDKQPLVNENVKELKVLEVVQAATADVSEKALDKDDLSEDIQGQPIIDELKEETGVKEESEGTLPIEDITAVNVEEPEVLPANVEDTLSETRAEESHSSDALLGTETIEESSGQEPQKQMLDDLHKKDADTEKVPEVDVTDTAVVTDATPDMQEELNQEKLIQEVIKRVVEKSVEIVSKSAAVNLEQQPDKVTKVSELNESESNQEENEKVLEEVSETMVEVQGKESVVTSDVSAVGMQSLDKPECFDVSTESHAEIFKETGVEQAKNKEVKEGELKPCIQKEVTEAGAHLDIIGSAVIATPNELLANKSEQPVAITSTSPSPSQETPKALTVTEIGNKAGDAVESVRPMNSAQKEESKKQTKVDAIYVQANQINEPVVQFDSMEKAVIVTQPEILDAVDPRPETAEPEASAIASPSPQEENESLVLNDVSEVEGQEETLAESSTPLQSIQRDVSKTQYAETEVFVQASETFEAAVHFDSAETAVSITQPEILYAKDPRVETIASEEEVLTSPTAQTEKMKSVTLTDGPEEGGQEAEAVATELSRNELQISESQMEIETNVQSKEITEPVPTFDVTQGAVIITQLELLDACAHGIETVDMKAKEPAFPSTQTETDESLTVADVSEIKGLKAAAVEAEQPINEQQIHGNKMEIEQAEINVQSMKITVPEKHLDSAERVPSMSQPEVMDAVKHRMETVEPEEEETASPTPEIKECLTMTGVSVAGDQEEMAEGPVKQINETQRAEIELEIEQPEINVQPTERRELEEHLVLHQIAEILTKPELLIPGKHTIESVETEEEAPAPPIPQTERQESFQLTDLSEIVGQKETVVEPLKPADGTQRSEIKMVIEPTEVNDLPPKITEPVAHLEVTEMAGMLATLDILDAGEDITKAIQTVEMVTAPSTPQTGGKEALTVKDMLEIAGQEKGTMEPKETVIEKQRAEIQMETEPSEVQPAKITELVAHVDSTEREVIAQSEPLDAGEDSIETVDMEAKEPVSQTPQTESKEPLTVVDVSEIQGQEEATVEHKQTVIKTQRAEIKMEIALTELYDLCPETTEPLEQLDATERAVIISTQEILGVGEHRIEADEMEAKKPTSSTPQTVAVADVSNVLGKEEMVEEPDLAMDEAQRVESKTQITGVNDVLTRVPEMTLESGERVVIITQTEVIDACQHQIETVAMEANTPASPTPPTEIKESLALTDVLEVVGQEERAVEPVEPINETQISEIKMETGPTGVNDLPPEIREPISSDSQERAMEITQLELLDACQHRIETVQPEAEATPKPQMEREEPLQVADVSDVEGQQEVVEEPVLPINEPQRAQNEIQLEPTELSEVSPGTTPGICLDSKESIVIKTQQELTDVDEHRVQTVEQEAEAPASPQTESHETRKLTDVSEVGVQENVEEKPIIETQTAEIQMEIEQHEVNIQQPELHLVLPQLTEILTKPEFMDDDGHRIESVETEPPSPPTPQTERQESLNLTDVQEVGGQEEVAGEPVQQMIETQMAEIKIEIEKPEVNIYKTEIREPVMQSVSPQSAEILTKKEFMDTCEHQIELVEPEVEAPASPIPQAESQGSLSVTDMTEVGEQEEASVEPVKLANETIRLENMVVKPTVANVQPTDITETMAHLVLPQLTGILTKPELMDTCEHQIGLVEPEAEKQASPTPQTESQESLSMTDVPEVGVQEDAAVEAVEPVNETQKPDSMVVKPTVTNIQPLDITETMASLVLPQSAETITQKELMDACEHQLELVEPEVEAPASPKPQTESQESLSLSVTDVPKVGVQEEAAEEPVKPINEVLRLDSMVIQPTVINVQPKDFTDIMDHLVLPQSAAAITKSGVLDACGHAIGTVEPVANVPASRTQSTEGVESLTLTNVVELGGPAEALNLIDPIQKAESNTQLHEIFVEATEIPEPGANLHSTELAVITPHPMLLDDFISEIEIVQAEEIISTVEETSSIQATEKVESLNPAVICDQEEHANIMEEEIDQDEWMDAEEVIYTQDAREVSFFEVEEPLESQEELVQEDTAGLEEEAASKTDKEEECKEEVLETEETCEMESEGEDFAIALEHQEYATTRVASIEWD